MALTDNLQGYWELEEASSTRLDSTANNNDLTEHGTGGVGQGTGIIDNCADFEKDDGDYLDISDGAQTGLDMTGDFTISMWVKSETQPATSNQNALITKEDQSGNNGYSIFYHDTLGVRTCVSNSGNECKSFSGVDLTNGTFFHLVFRFTDSSKEHSLWVDGVEETTQTGTKTPPDTANAFVLGADVMGGTNHDGLIDEVGIWDRALTDAEIADLYNGGAGLAYPLVPAGAIFIPKITIF